MTRKSLGPNIDVAGNTKSSIKSLEFKKGIFFPTAVLWHLGTSRGKALQFTQGGFPITKSKVPTKNGR